MSACGRVCACTFGRVCVRVYVCESACVCLCVRARVRASACVCACSNAMCLCACTYAGVCQRAGVRVSVCVFPFYLQYVDRNKCHGLSLITSGGCSCLFVYGTSRLNAMMFQTSPYMGILYEYIYVRMLGCMSTPLYVHVTHTQHTHTHTHNTHTCLGLYVCILVVCALQEVQHVSTFTPLALGSGFASS